MHPSGTRPRSPNPSRLDLATFPSYSEGTVIATLHAEAGEASITCLPPGYGEHSDMWLAGQRCLSADPQPVWVHKDSAPWREHLAHRRQLAGARGLAKDPERSLREACRRATKKARLFAKTHRLFRLVTLTYAGAGEHTWDRCWRDYAAFRERALRVHPSLVLLAFAEPHPSGHGWHLHLLISQFVHKKPLQALWGHGFVDVRAGRDRSGRFSPGLVAAYIAKYVAKTADPAYVRAVGVDARRLGQHRYRADNGLDTWPEQLRGNDPRAIFKALVGYMGEPPDWVRPFTVAGTEISGWALRWPEPCWFHPSG